LPSYSQLYANPVSLNTALSEFAETNPLRNIEIFPLSPAQLRSLSPHSAGRQVSSHNRLFY